MARRKRVLLCLCLLIVAAIGVTLWASRGGSKPSVSVTFIGYTNVSTTILGVVRVTNTSPVGVYVWGVYPSGSNTNKFIPINFLAHFSRPRSTSTFGGPEFLEPWKASDVWVLSPSMEISLESGAIIEPWSAEVFFGHWGPRERFYKWAYLSGGSIGRRWIDSTDPKSELWKITVGPVTNQIPTNLLPAAVPVSNSTKVE